MTYQIKVPQKKATSLVSNLSIIYMHLFLPFSIEFLSLSSYFEVETRLECFEWPFLFLSSGSGLPSPFFRLKFWINLGF